MYRINANPQVLNLVLCKAVGDGPGTWVLVTYLGDPDGVLALVSSSPGCWGHFERKPADERSLSFLASFPLCLSD